LPERAVGDRVVVAIGLLVVVVDVGACSRSRSTSRSRLNVAREISRSSKCRVLTSRREPEQAVDAIEAFQPVHG
jgi:hypothetical protein